MSFNKVVVLEVFCGKARLSMALRSKGFSCFSIDSVGHKGVPILRLNLLRENDLSILSELISKHVILYAHFGPPCGTSSAARGIPVNGRPGPPKLRSMQHTMGLKSLTGKDKSRVLSANRLYEITVALIFQLHEAGGYWSVENPASSMMWVTTPFVRLQKCLAKQFFGLSFHTCMFGAPRKKHTALWTNMPMLKRLQRFCVPPADHVHLAWGLTAANTFATADECAYNANLSAHWADAVAAQAIESGMLPPPVQQSDIQEDDTMVRPYLNRAAAGLQPRGNRLPPLLTDFFIHETVSLETQPWLRELYPGKRLPSNEQFPPGARILSFSNDDTGGADVVGEKVTVGVPLDPLSYLQQACNAEHPSERCMVVDDHTERAVQILMGGDPLESRRLRISEARVLIEIVKQFADDDKVPAHLQKVMRGKKWTAFNAALLRVGYADASVALEAMNGFPLAGWLPSTSVFPTLVKPPEMHVNELATLASSYAARALASVKTPEDVELSRELWDITMDEVEAGFLEGPFKASDLPDGAVVSPRFAIRQSNKSRPIDNFTSSGVNGTVGLGNKLQVEGVDHVVALLVRCMEVGGKGAKLVGRTYDLRKAYRQLGVRAEDLRYAWICVWDPEAREPKVFLGGTLPFGASASVAAFLRASKALRELGTRMFSLVWAAYFDDFVCICRPGEEDSTDMAVRFLFKTLGWWMSESPEKEKPFSEVFTALGVEFDLRRAGSGELLVGNTESRRKEIGEALHQIIDEDALTPESSARLRGRLLFAEAHIFGRSAKIALRAVGEPSVTGRTTSPLDAKILFGLRWMLDRVINAPPRLVTTKPCETLLLFLDGACEPRMDEPFNPVTSVGGLLCSKLGEGIECFGEYLPEDVVTTWANGVRTQLVFEAEILPYLLSLSLWGDRLRGCKLLVFLDNEAARHSWISGHADATFARYMTHAGTLMEASLMVDPFFARVPTFSNLADGPSRMSFDVCSKLGAKRIRLDEPFLRKCALSNPLRE